MQGPGALLPLSGRPLLLTTASFPALRGITRDLLVSSSSVTNFFFLRKKQEKHEKITKNTNLIGCPSDQVKDWALATRSGREGERRKEKGKREMK